MTVFRKFLFLMGQVGLMMLARYFFQWIMKFSTESANSLIVLTIMWRKIAERMDVRFTNGHFRLEPVSLLVWVSGPVNAGQQCAERFAFVGLAY